MEELKIGNFLLEKEGQPEISVVKERQGFGLSSDISQSGKAHKYIYVVPSVADIPSNCPYQYYPSFSSAINGNVYTYELDSVIVNKKITEYLNVNQPTNVLSYYWVDAFIRKDTDGSWYMYDPTYGNNKVLKVDTPIPGTPDKILPVVCVYKKVD